MKFQDEYGNIYENMYWALKSYCRKYPRCVYCPRPFRRKREKRCAEFMIERPLEAAKLIGCKVINDDSDIAIATELGESSQNGDAESESGLYGKYIVRKADSGEEVEDCFVLRPLKDPAAVAALREYAKMTENKELADDILHWVGDKEDKPMKKPLKDWALEEVAEECKKHATCKDATCPFVVNNPPFGNCCRLDGTPEDCWGLTDPPCFMPEEVAGAKAIKQLFPWADSISREGDFVFIVCKREIEGVFNEITLKFDTTRLCEDELFPSIKPGRAVKISDIIGGIDEQMARGKTRVE